MEKQSILMVGNHQENFLVLEAPLEDLNLNLVRAGSGNEALTLMLETDFALVLLHVQMPDIDGYKTARLIRQFEGTKHVPIVFVMAKSTDERLLFKGHEKGAVDYLFRPIVPELLCHKVKIFTDLHRQRELARKRNNESRRFGGIIQVCATCKKIRNDSGDWDELEVYLDQNTETQFSHGICDECLDLHYPEVNLQQCHDDFIRADHQV